MPPAGGGGEGHPTPSRPHALTPHAPHPPPHDHPSPPAPSPGGSAAPTPAPTATIAPAVATPTAVPAATATLALSRVRQSERHRRAYPWRRTDGHRRAPSFAHRRADAHAHPTVPNPNPLARTDRDAPPGHPDTDQTDRQRLLHPAAMAGRWQWCPLLRLWRRERA
ncbi:MAG: hypothetical protein U0232_14465 [Thermomicrobiales bacterium]